MCASIFVLRPAALRLQALAKELVALRPDVILAHSAQIAAALQQETRAIPIVFVNSQRSDRRRLRRQRGATGRQSHRPAALRGRHLRQVAGICSRRSPRA